jgi:hypothetical protein
MPRYVAIFVFAVAAAVSVPGHAADPQWTTTELQFQLGKLETPKFAGGGSQWTPIITGQHASGWSFGDFFMFTDLLKGGESEETNFNHWDVYTEAYANFSSSKILKAKYGDGPLQDIGLIAGINYDHDARVLKFLPGVRLAWKVPGFAFFNTDVTAYIDASKGVRTGESYAPKESDSFMVDWNFASKSFQISDQYFNVEGHVEYIGKRHNEFGDPVSWHILAQPQLRWDAGNAVFGKRNKLFLGTEYQLWINKLGEKGTDESVFQALAVWRF